MDVPVIPAPELSTATEVRFSRACLIAAFALTVLWGLIYARFAHSPLCDESGHFSIVYHFAEGRPGLPANLTMPPGYHFVVLALSGEYPSLRRARLTTTLFALLGVAAFAGGWRQLHGRPPGPATLLFALLPILQPFTGMIYSDAPGLAVLLCAAWAQFAGRGWGAAGLLSIACFIRQTNLVWVAFFIAWEACKVLSARQDGSDPLGRRVCKTVIARAGGHLLVLVAAAAIIAAAGRFTPGTDNGNALRLNPAAFHFAALLVVFLGLPIWFTQVGPMFSTFRAALSGQPKRTLWWVAAGVIIVVLLAATFENPHPWNRYLWLDQMRYTVLRNWPLIWIDTHLPLRLASGAAIVFSALAITKICCRPPYGLSVALTLPFAVALIGSNSLVDPRYYITPIVLVLLFVRPSPREFRLLGRWWALICLVHAPFIIAGYSLW